MTYTCHTIADVTNVLSYGRRGMFMCVLRRRVHYESNNVSCIIHTHIYIRSYPVSFSQNLYETININCCYYLIAYSLLDHEKRFVQFSFSK